MKKNFSLSPAQLTALGLGILVVLLIVSALLSRGTQQVESIPNPINNTFTPPQGEKVNVQSGNAQQHPVNNFYKEPVATTQTGTAIMTETLEYQLIYNNDKKIFFVNILPYTPPETRATAENALLEKLGVTEETACTLSVEVHDYSKGELTDEPVISKPSFCTN